MTDKERMVLLEARVEFAHNALFGMPKEQQSETTRLVVGTLAPLVKMPQVLAFRSASGERSLALFCNPGDAELVIELMGIAGYKKEDR